MKSEKSIQKEIDELIQMRENIQNKINILSWVREEEE